MIFDVLKTKTKQHDANEDLNINEFKIATWHPCSFRGKVDKFHTPFSKFHGLLLQNGRNSAA